MNIPVSPSASLEEQLQQFMSEVRFGANLVNQRLTEWEQRKIKFKLVLKCLIPFLESDHFAVAVAAKRIAYLLEPSCVTHTDLQSLQQSAYSSVQEFATKLQAYYSLKSL